MKGKLRELGRKAKRLFLRTRIRHLSRAAWRDRHAEVYRRHPQYRAPCPKNVEEAHLRMWSALGVRVKPDTLRICYHVSGVADPRMVPEEIFAAEVEPALNRHDAAVLLENKSIYNRWLPGMPFPEPLLHNIDGQFFGGDYQPLAKPDVRARLDDFEYPVVLKPSMGGLGGRGVRFPASSEELADAMARDDNFVVQRRLRQHPFFARFNPHGLNTLKVCTCRSVVTNEVHVLNAAMRMGVGGGLDNEAAGGLVRFVNADGRLNGYAVDKYGSKYATHPDTGMDFSVRETVPDFADLKALLERAGRDLYLTRLVGFDACLDQHGQWRIIEINLRSQSSRFSQYGGHPFFGEFTDEVIRYVREHPRWA